MTTINTATEAAALKIGTKITDVNGAVWVIRISKQTGKKQMTADGMRRRFELTDIPFPATIN